jgi:hypothetical protein
MMPLAKRRRFVRAAIQVRATVVSSIGVSVASSKAGIAGSGRTMCSPVQTDFEARGLGRPRDPDCGGRIPAGPKVDGE